MSAAVVVPSRAARERIADEVPRVAGRSRRLNWSLIIRFADAVPRRRADRDVVGDEMYSGKSQPMLSSQS